MAFVGKWRKSEDVGSLVDSALVGLFSEGETCQYDSLEPDVVVKYTPVKAGKDKMETPSAVRGIPLSGTMKI